MAHADPFRDLQANAAGADNAQDGGGARVAFEEIQRMAQHDGCHLRQDPEAHDERGGTTGGGDPLGLLLLGILDCFGVELGQHGDIRRRDGQHAGQWAKPHRAHIGQRPDELIHPPKPVKDAAQREAEQRVRDDVARAQKAQRDGDDGGDEGAEEGHGEAFGKPLQDFHPLLARRRRYH